MDSRPAGAERCLTAASYGSAAPNGTTLAGRQGREAYRLRVAEGIIAAWDASPADPALALEEAADTMFLAPAPSVREATNVLLRALGMPGGPSA